MKYLEELKNIAETGLNEKGDKEVVLVDIISKLAQMERDTQIMIVGDKESVYLEMNGSFSMKQFSTKVVGIVNALGDSIDNFGKDSDFTKDTVKEIGYKNALIDLFSDKINVPSTENLTDEQIECLDISKIVFSSLISNSFTKVKSKRN